MSSFGRDERVQESGVVGHSHDSDDRIEDLDIYEAWVTVAAAVEPVIADVATRQQQEHWTGAGAADYMKQLPFQLSALNEFTAYAGVAGAGVETPAHLQQSVFSSEITCWAGPRRRFRGTPVQTPATRTSSAAPGLAASCRSAATGSPTS